MIGWLDMRGGGMILNFLNFTRLWSWNYPARPKMARGTISKWWQFWDHFPLKASMDLHGICLRGFCIASHVWLPQGYLKDSKRDLQSPPQVRLMRRWSCQCCRQIPIPMPLGTASVAKKILGNPMGSPRKWFAKLGMAPMMHLWLGLQHC